MLDGETQNQVQTEKLSGRVMPGSEKNWLLVAVKNALNESAPNGPDAWEVGEDAEAVSAPVMPVTSRKKLPSLNG